MRTSEQLSKAVVVRALFGTLLVHIALIFLLFIHFPEKKQEVLTEVGLIESLPIPIKTPPVEPSLNVAQQGIQEKIVSPVQDVPALQKTPPSEKPPMPEKALPMKEDISLPHEKKMDKKKSDTPRPVQEKKVIEKKTEPEKPLLPTAEQLLQKTSEPNDKLAELQKKILESEEQGLNKNLQSSQIAKEIDPNELAKFVQLIHQKVRQNINSQICAKDAVLKFEISLDTRGNLNGAPKLIDGTNSSACNSDIERAIIKAQPLPVPQQAELFEKFKLFYLRLKPNE